jgi:hypothetical protein
LKKTQHLITISSDNSDKTVNSSTHDECSPLAYYQNDPLELLPLNDTSSPQLCYPGYSSPEQYPLENNRDSVSPKDVFATFHILSPLELGLSHELEGEETQTVFTQDLVTPKRRSESPRGTKRPRVVYQSDKRVAEQPSKKAKTIVHKSPQLSPVTSSASQDSHSKGVKESFSEEDIDDNYSGDDGNESSEDGMNTDILCKRGSHKT